MNAINERRSIRKFKDKTLRKEDVDAVINAAILAPSAKNRQPWHYIIYSGMQKEKLLAAMEKGLIRERDIQKTLPNSSSGIPDAFYTLDVMKQAPVIIIVLNTNGSSPFEPICADDRISEMCDALSIGASIQNLLLKATELNIGSLWIANTCYAYNEIVEFIGTDYQLIGAVALGYPDESPHPRPRKSADIISEYRTDEEMEILAACGNNCAKCPRHLPKTETELRSTAELWMKIGYRDHIVSNNEIACSGCKADNWCRYNIVSCTSERNISNCGDCSEYPCEKLLECFRVTDAFIPQCKAVCSESEFLQLKNAFFDKKHNLDRHLK